VIAAVLCAVIGLVLAVVGFRLVRSSEVPEGDTSFVRSWSPRSVSFAGGWVLLFLGLLVLMVGTPMVYMSG
jgi:hypothetical protein